MKKRVRLHELRVGMFVERVEGAPSKQGPLRDNYVISSPKELRQLMQCHAMSAIIDLDRGCDTGDGPSAPSSKGQAELEEELLQHYSSEEVAQAKSTIAKAVPNIRQMMGAARENAAFDLEMASVATADIMASAADNAGALIGLAKLKQVDEGTFLHSLSVAALMITFGRALGLDETMVRELGMGGLVHDIGKTVIPLNVLQKGDKLTNTEFSIIRSHPQRGYAILKRSGPIPESVLAICLSHHEKFDGGGYPQGLAGHKIPYVARIASICDVYDALTTVRPYKAAWTKAEALEKMLASRGHFDLALLRAFISKMVIGGELKL